jgi:hypothetical protein
MDVQFGGFLVNRDKTESKRGEIRKKQMEFVIGETKNILGFPESVRPVESAGSAGESGIGLITTAIVKNQRILQLYDAYKSRCVVPHTFDDFSDILLYDVGAGESLPEEYTDDLHTAIAERLSKLSGVLHTQLDTQEWGNTVKDASDDIFQPVGPAPCSFAVNRVLKRLQDAKTGAVHPSLLARSQRLTDLRNGTLYSSRVSASIHPCECGTESDTEDSSDDSSVEPDADSSVEYIGVTRLNSVGRMCNKHWKNKNTLQRKILLERLLEFKYRKMPYTRLQKILRELKVQGYYRSKDIKLMSKQIMEILQTQVAVSVPQRFARFLKSTDSFKWNRK